MGKKKQANQLGRSLIKDRFSQGNRKKVNNDTMLHTTEIQDGYDWGRLNLQSVTEESSFQEFLRTAELAGTEFQAEKLNITFINPKSKVGILTHAERVELAKKHEAKKDVVRIPRRPKWDENTSAEDLLAAENAEFLEWRRSLALLQENDGLLLTPYEKNLEFWRQLWRVVERSDVVVQIVDARNPLLFRCVDLEKYVKEVDPNKQCMLLLNKSDFLNEEQRKCWATYFTEQNVKFAFFSATLADQEMEKIVEESDEDDSEQADDEDSDLSGDESDENDENPEKFDEKPKENGTEPLEKGVEEIKIAEKNPWDILTRTELINHFKTIEISSPVTPGINTIGLVGYPNVGKSSTINAILTEKKVSVSATPGKTKHFQTLYVDETLLLCDCPGLVFPSFVATKADMILNGILPIDQMRDYVPPVNLLCELIPRHVLEDKYGMMIAKPVEGEDPLRPPHAEELLLAHAYVRGFMTSNGQPDQSRSARIVLKDYVNGKLCYCYAPPGTEQKTFHVFPERQKAEIKIELLPPRQQRAMKMDKSQVDTINSQFFSTTSQNAHVKGRFNFPNVRAGGALCVPSGSSTSVNGSMVSLAGVGEKPWKNRKKQKREKLRKTYKHLDEH
ncbi:large subunit GTPase 1 homolog [Culicoides brevitarsis]|uniref:large subunit GTPase 1 homolog n=1 Tax=Culicoides brevitarsis TaxID=469753 RepID=UPI00307B13E0